MMFRPEESRSRMLDLGAALLRQLAAETAHRVLWRWRARQARYCLGPAGRSRLAVEASA